MERGLDELIHHRRDALTFYSPYSFIKEIRSTDQFDFFVKKKIEEFGTRDSSFQFEVTVDGENFVFLYEFLTWDSNYFNRPCYKLFTVLFSQQIASALITAILLFKEKLQEATNVYCFADLPTEDIFLIQCLNAAGVRLVETRLHYVRRNLENFVGERYSVRKATQADIPSLASVAASSRNDFDRLHADYAFSEQEADDYLATYAEAAVNGFCDAVLVPDVPNHPVASFIAFNQHINNAQENSMDWIHLSLAAVSPENRGWFVKLLSEVVHHGRELQLSFVECTTQTSNRAIIRSCEKLGFDLGATSHILTFSK